MKKETKRRTYGQYCPLARSLDLLGERWTLLIVRNLLLGPQRYKDLLEGLPGIGTNLLAARLRRLRQADIVARRSLPPPASGSVYELTEHGLALEPILFDLVRWHMGSLGPRRRAEVVRPEWAMLGLRVLFDPEAARGLRAVYEYRIEDQVFHLRVDDGEAEVVRGPAESPDARITCDAATFLSIGAGAVSRRDALVSGRLALEGEPAALAASARIFRMLPEPS